MRVLRSNSVSLSVSISKAVGFVARDYTFDIGTPGNLLYEVTPLGTLFGLTSCSSMGGVTARFNRLRVVACRKEERPSSNAG